MRQQDDDGPVAEGKAYDFVLWLLPKVDNFPRRNRFRAFDRRVSRWICAADKRDKTLMNHAREVHCLDERPVSHSDSSDPEEVEALSGKPLVAWRRNSRQWKRHAGNSHEAGAAAPCFPEHGGGGRVSQGPGGIRRSLPRRLTEPELGRSGRIGTRRYSS